VGCFSEGARLQEGRALRNSPVGCFSEGARLQGREPPVQPIRDYLLSALGRIVGDPSRGGFKGIRSERPTGFFVLFKALIH